MADTATKLPDMAVVTREKRKALVDALLSGTFKNVSEALCPTSSKQYHRRYLDLNAALDECGNTFLHMTVSQSDVSAASQLLLHGASPNVWNNSGATPLRLAKLLQCTPIIQILQRHGAVDDDLPDPEALQVPEIQEVESDPVEDQQVDSVSEIPSPAIRTQNPIDAGSTSLAVRKASSTFVQRKASLPTASATPERQQATSLKSATATIVTLQSVPSVSASPVRDVALSQLSYTGVDITSGAYMGLRTILAMFQNGADDVGDKYGANSLMKSAYRNQADMVNVILAQGKINARARDQRGFTALLWACCGGAELCVAVFIEHFKNIGCLQEELAPQGLTPATSISPLIAAVFYGHHLVVAQILQTKLISVDQKLHNGATAMIIAVWQGNFRVIIELLKAGSKPPENVEAWILKGLSTMDSGGENGKRVVPSVAPLPKLPSGKTQLNVASDLIEILRRASGTSTTTQRTLTTNEQEAIKALAQDDKTMEYLKGVWGSRIATNMINYSSEETKEFTRKMEREMKKTLRIDGQMDHSFEIELSSLLKKYRKRGTVLDQMMMSMVKQVVSLILAAKSDIKTEYVVISGKAIQEAGEIVRLIESVIDRKDVAAGSKVPLVMPQPLMLLFNGPFTDKIRNLCRVLRNSHVQQMLMVTRLAVGAWPPPDAVVNMIDAACKLATACFNLVLYTGALGVWPTGDIDLSQFAFNSSSETPTSSTTDHPARNLSYNDYQRQHETSLLEKISSNDSAASPTTPATASCPVSTGPDPADVGFYSSLDNSVRIFVTNIQKLKAAKEAERKEEYASLASSVYATVDAVIEEIRAYYVFKSLPDNFKLSADEPVYKRKLKILAEDSIQRAEELILKSKLACGIWPPPDAALDMMKSSVPIITQVKQMVMYVKEVARVSRQSENEERQKVEQFMGSWLKNQQVRTLFSEWEKIHMKSTKGSDAIDSSANMTDEESKILEDSMEGLVVEVKDGKEIVKAGRLLKLVERLADHKFPDVEYRSAFLLTHHSFTTSLDLLDILIKRYDIGPPYGLDQRAFNLYVNKKIVPVRLRVYNVLKIWMATYTEDFTCNRQLTEKCLQFVQTKMAADFGEIALALMETLRRCLVTSAPLVSSAVDTRIQPKSILPKGVGPDEITTFLSHNARAFIDIDPMEMARQLTLVDFNTYKSIKATECLDQGWEKKDKATRSPNISKMIKHMNNVTMWVAHSIVQCDDIKARMAVIRYFINVANACKELNNFNGITAFIAGFSMGPVHRMTRTWNTFKEKFPKVSELQEELSDLASAKGQYSKYRQALKAATPPIVPFLGVFLTDLTFVELGNVDFLPDTNYINFDKRRKVAVNIKDIQQYQQTTFALTEVPQLRDFIQNLGAEGWLEEKALYAKSWEVEPREESVDDDD